MRTLHSLSVALLVFLLAGLPAAQAPQETTLAAGSATLDEIKGEVTVRLPGATAATKPQLAQSLPPETVIEVGKGSALLHLEDGSQVLIKKNSRVVLKSAHEGAARYFELLLGKILAKVQKRMGNTPSFRLGTPTAVITVRGTRFEVSVNDKGKTYVEVYEGLVEVVSIGVTGPPVLLRPGFHTDVVRDHAPERPERAPGFEDDRRTGVGGNDDSLRPGTQTEREGTQSTQPNQESEPPH